MTKILGLHQFLVSACIGIGTGPTPAFLVVSELVRYVTQVHIPLLYEVITSFN